MICLFVMRDLVSVQKRFSSSVLVQCMRPIGVLQIDLEIAKLHHFCGVFCFEMVAFYAVQRCYVYPNIVLDAVFI